MTLYYNFDGFDGFEFEADLKEYLKDNYSDKEIISLYKDYKGFDSDWDIDINELSEDELSDLADDLISELSDCGEFISDITNDVTEYYRDEAEDSFNDYIKKNNDVYGYYGLNRKDFL